MWSRFLIIIYQAPSFEGGGEGGEQDGVLFDYMTNDIDIQKLKSEYPEFFEQVSPELLKIIFSEETSSKIANICFQNGVEDEEKIEKIAYQVAFALLGRIPKENLPEILEKGAKLSSETARKIYIEVNLFIFSQIKETQPEKTQPEEIKTEQDQIEEDELTEPTKPSAPIEKKPETSPKKDVYREPIK